MKLTGILLASMLLVGFCHAQDRTAARPPPIAAESTRFGWADVLRVDPVYESVSDAAPPAVSEDGGPAARPDCNEAPPPPSPPQHDGEQADNRATGTMIGALIGVVVGHAFGRGDGNKAATVAGGVAGGIAGNRIAAAQDQAANNQAQQQQADAERDAVTASLRDCREARPIRGSTQPERRITGYDVEYRYKGEIYMARLPFDPGDRMRVKITVVPVE